MVLRRSCVGGEATTGYTDGHVRVGSFLGDLRWRISLPNCHEHVEGFVGGVASALKLYIWISASGATSLTPQNRH